ncbi:uncharacterized protein GGS22DRAFT_187354 [Annulohypoxylon maeteangense]|uniref:uncharacterized protein n=1 Tax=Annulohypoxylon maeteangense TaxID=1927788 RepID=UPI0020077877|nr:uncharacterized protein GGS22DRAFT_187354 [Annulohypoxylon maeteangense]KAI0886120.1 hypothetical protein GGS22DRAFT_187354 [Annulohypoxylon maeteangense]
MPNRFCPLCDVLIDVWINPDDGLANPQYPANWLQEVRAVRTTDGLEFPFVTGVGWLESDECIIAPVGYECHYRDRDPQQQLDDYFTGHQISYFRQGTAGYWCYAVHNACWELLRDRIDPDRQFSSDVLAQHLFALLYNTPVNAGNEALIPGHDYGHASDFHLRTGELYHDYFTRVKESDYFFITGDVGEKFEPDEDSLEDESLSLYVNSAHLSIYRGNYKGSDGLCLLPRELIMLVLAYLPSSDVCKLRLISRYVADLSSPALLDQKFWSSRFGPEFEMGFVFAGLSNLRPAEPTDWRMLYLKAKSAIRSEMFYGLKNRRRIWHTFQNISDALYARLENVWQIDNTYNGPPSDTTRSLPQGMVFAEASFESENTRLPLAKIPLSLSCRLFEWRDFIWSRPRDIVSKTLRVSTIYSNGQTYVSGFRLRTTDSLGRVDELPRVGFVNSRKEYDVFIGPNQFIGRVDVAMATKGLRGLRFYIRGLQDSCTVAIGDMELTDPGSGVAKLIPGEEDTRCTGFYLGFDACKVISISLMGQEVRTLSNPIKKYADPGSHNTGPLEVWNPNMPITPPTWCFPESSSTQHFNLCLNMDFGGPGGQLLQSLVRIDALMGGYPSVFLGICFIYGDGSERLYGRKSFRNSLDDMASTPSIRQCFLVDGSRGELMTEIIISRCPEADTIQAITISTNFDRMQQFRLYGKDSFGPSKDREAVQVLRPTPGMHFTTFHVKIQSPLGHFRNFSAHSQVINTKLREPVFEPSGVPHHLPFTVDIQKSAEDILAYPRGLAFTAADISNLSKVRVSVNDESHSNIQGHISGLWLEYHDSNAPVILGQWMKELGSLDLPIGDRITEVVTWHDYTNRHRRVKYGPIKRLRLGTVLGNTMEFLDSHRGGKICLQYRENPFEKLWDHVRVFYSPTTNDGKTRSLVYSNDYSCPPWAVTQKVFMQEAREDSRPNLVTTIEISFKEIAREISGLTFIYEDGRRIALGVRGTDGTSVTLSSGEKLVQMEFLTTSGRRMDFSKQDPDLVKNRTVQRTIYTLNPPSPRQSSVFSVSPCPIPKGAGSFAGFWALPRQVGSLRYGRFGPIFEKIGDEGLE